MAEAAGLLRQVVYRVQDDPAKEHAMLAQSGEGGGLPILAFPRRSIQRRPSRNK
jgi:hypothetical protein